jgi:hypothetical protein
VDLAHGGHKRYDFNAVHHFEVLFSDGTGRDAPCNIVDSGTGARAETERGIPMVSRALLRPPPLLALMPYFWR